MRRIQTYPKNIAIKVYPDEDNLAASEQTQELAPREEDDREQLRQEQIS